MTLSDTILREVVAGYLTATPSAPIGVAVSGGSDSLALMILMRDWAQEVGADLRVVTVDHGLRAEAAEEAQYVGRIAADLGLSHDILRWQGWDGTGNLQDRARRARYSLMTDWAKENGIEVIALGHTADDQAETFLMRLSREAGADGLAAMQAKRLQRGITFLRPMLSLHRAELQAFLTRRDLTWVSDPSNDDPRYDRVRARQALQVLEPLGVTVASLNQVSRNLADIRETLAWYTFVEARQHVRVDHGDIVIPLAAYRTFRPEISRRLLQQALIWVSGAEYPPRRKGMTLLQLSLSAGTGMPLAGCRVTVARGDIRITREAAALKDLTAAPGEPWDGRWRLIGPAVPGAEVRVTGETGLKTCPDWRETGLPRTTLLAAPAVWQGDELVAAPLAGRAEGWRAELLRSDEQFFATLLTH
ncbi:tRNA lysidine(34) synthetase TilS [Pseudooceanicola atlanticus]|uniref:tRNA lysidine(34) synthetase TilS n=1 Tax=Pseudooceanicola atlanticus TaxID=1461694 RepID=UPI0009DD209D|nr:tRNA lysidine(34) synthetase TilS [Pseudooceanicola atlanticus]